MPNHSPLDILCADADASASSGRVYAVDRHNRLHVFRPCKSVDARPSVVWQLERVWGLPVRLWTLYGFAVHGATAFCFGHHSVPVGGLTSVDDSVPAAGLTCVDVGGPTLELRELALPKELVPMWDLSNGCMFIAETRTSAWCSCERSAYSHDKSLSMSSLPDEMSASATRAASAMRDEECTGPERTARAVWGAVASIPVDLARLIGEYAPDGLRMVCVRSIEVAAETHVSGRVACGRLFVLSGCEGGVPVLSAFAASGAVLWRTSLPEAQDVEDWSVASEESCTRVYAEY